MARLPIREAEMVIAVQRRVVITSIGFFLLEIGIGKAAVPPGVEARRVRIQLDEGALNKIPGDERTSLQEQQGFLNDGAKSDPEHSTGPRDPNYLCGCWCAIDTCDLEYNSRDASA